MHVAVSFLSQHPAIVIFSALFSDTENNQNVHKNIFKIAIFISII